MTISLFGLSILIIAVGGVVVQQSYESNGVSFNDCESAIRYAESSSVPITVDCHMTMRFGRDENTDLEQVTKSQVISRNDRAKLSDFRLTDEYPLDNADASGITFVSDDMLLITYQTSLEFRDIEGRVHHKVGPVDGDIEGLEYQDGRLIAVDERGSSHIDVTIDGMKLENSRDYILPESGIECVAYDPARDVVYYGQESTGILFNDEFEVLYTFPRDLSACTVYQGELMAIVSHPWRQSVWYRLDMNSWSVLDVKPLPDGDWEGIACRNDICVLVRELSEKSTAAMAVFGVRSGAGR